MFIGIRLKSNRAPRFLHASLFPLRGIAKVYTQKIKTNETKKNHQNTKFMFEIIQAEKDFESVIDSKETQAEAQEYVTALNDTKKNKKTFFYCKKIKTQQENEND